MLGRQKLRVQNQKGISTVELIPVLLLFALMFNYGLGFFGVIHSGILNSIAARNYAFETFRNRPNLNYLRDSADMAQDSTAIQAQRYGLVQFRFHGIISETSPNDTWHVTRRPLKFTEAQQGQINNVGTNADHNQLVRQIADNGDAKTVFVNESPDEGKSGVSPVWIQVLYGICLNAQCHQ